MRTMCGLALVCSLLAAGCSTTGANLGGWANDGANLGCATGGCDSGGCASGDCDTSANFSDYNFNCGPMCGAYVTDDQTASPMSCDGNCEMGATMMPGYLANAAAGVRGRMHQGMANAKGRVAGGLCKGMGSMVGCFGCRECGGGNAVGLNNSNSSGSIVGCTGKGGCKCHRCTAGSLFHPYGGQIPHTANAAATGMGGSGFGQGGSAPTYAYPYYTTRGPRDFLQDGCGPPPIYPSNPRPNCLPTIGG